MALLNKNNTDDDIDSLLAKYIAGQANADESSRAERWIAAGGTNAKYAEHLRLIWEESSRLSFKGSIDAHRAWEGFHRRILEKPGAVAQSGPIRRRIGWMRAAAILVVMIGVGTSIYTWHGARNNVPVILHPFSGSQVRTYTLPDGSIVRLDPNSSLSYPSQFISNQRNVGLEGGAFFTVAPDPRKPFRVIVNGITVTVLGTSFSITSSSGRTEIVVKTGNIEVTGKHRNLKLCAGEKLTVLDVDTGWVKESDSSENSKANQEIGRKPSGSKLRNQKPDMKTLPQAASSSLAPALTSDPLPASNHPRPRFDELENKIREEQMKGIVSDLLSDNLINNIQKVFKEKYNVTTDRGFFFGPFVVPKIARGMHVNRDWLLGQKQFQ